jgi:hypothetical protein
MKNELQKTWKETLLSLFKVLSHLLPVGSVENHETFIHGTRSPDSSLSEGPSVQDVGKLTTCVRVRVCVFVCVYVLHKQENVECLCSNKFFQ